MVRDDRRMARLNLADRKGGLGGLQFEQNMANGAQNKCHCILYLSLTIYQSPSWHLWAGAKGYKESRTEKSRRNDKRNPGDPGSNNTHRVQGVRGR